METVSSVEACVDAMLERVGKRVRLGTPLGLGKPNHLLNALYRRAKADPSIELHILTALSLVPPEATDELAGRLLGPIKQRLFAGHPDLEYELDRRAGRLPDNVRVIEFYLAAGRLTKNAAAQRDYISTNYTHVVRDLMDRGVNVLVQQVCRRDGDSSDEPLLSLSCNPDVTLDLAAALEKSGRPHFLAAQINQELPFLYGDAVLAADFFDVIVDDPQQYAPLFGVPKAPIRDEDYLIGLYASTLIKDGGELQIGIGSLGEALAYCLKLRHEDSAAYNEALELLGVRARFAPILDRIGETGPFRQGLFAATEMLSDGFMHLLRAGIVKRRVYDDVPLQRLLNAGRITEAVGPETLEVLLQARIIPPRLGASDLSYLQHWGILREDLSFVGGNIELPSGTVIEPDLGRAESRALIEAFCLGRGLRHGRAVHAGFFLGSQDFYRWLRELPEEERALIDMRSVRRINQLYGHEEIDRLHRRHARFVNTAMIVTLLGAAASDGLAGGEVVSGVGGQYNFVAMAHALPEGRSIIQLRSTRGSGWSAESNLVYSYGHATIPRHLRDLVITEYGIADLRGKTDEEVVQELVSIADARFQPWLLFCAKRHGKLAPDWQVPEAHRANTKERFREPLAQLRQRGLFPRYPFGTELTYEEIVIERALRALRDKTASVPGAIGSAAAALMHGSPEEAVRPYLARMGLEHPRTALESIHQRVLAAEIKAQLAAGAG